MTDKVNIKWWLLPATLVGEVEVPAGATKDEINEAVADAIAGTVAWNWTQEDKY